METIYPDDDEIKFRQENYGVIDHLLNDNAKCTICNNDILNEIISKKMIMVHKSHLCLCCYNCFYKLCEGNKYSCILCKSNTELSNCGKCNFNVCNRCINNHNINQVNKQGILNECFSCKPQILWKQRAQAAIILNVFSSQLDMPNGLLVNEVECEQTVRKYLINEAKVGQSSITDNLKDHMCLDFVLNSYKLNVMKKLSDFSPQINSSVSTKDYLNEFIQVCEFILENTCSTLTNFKRIFNLNSNLNPGVSAIMKSLLKSFDGDENILKLNRVVKKVVNNYNDNQSLKHLKSEDELNTNNGVLKPIPQSSLQHENSQQSISGTDKQLRVIVERLDESVLKKNNITNSPSNTQTETEVNGTIHPLDLFNDISETSSDEENIRELRSRKVVQKNKEGRKKQAEKSTKNILDARSDDEKENDRLISLNNIERCSVKKIVLDTNDNDSDDNIDIDGKTNSKPIKKNEEINKMEIMNQTIINIDDIESDTDDNSNKEDYTLKSVKDIFSQVKNTIGISQISNEPDSTESDDSAIFDVVNSCLTVFKKSGIDSNKNQKNQKDINDEETFIDFSESETEEKNENSDLSNKDDETYVSHSKKLKYKMPSIYKDSSSDSNLKITKKSVGTKRKLISSTSTDSFNSSDSSSKYFKKTPKIYKGKGKNYFHNSTNSSSSSSSYDDTKSSTNVKKHKRIKKLSPSESDKTDSDSNMTINRTPTKKGRKNIRRLKKKTELSQLTLSALKEEEARKKRIEERQKMYNKIYDLPKPMESLQKLVLDFNPITKEDLIIVQPDLVKLLKPHQVEGIKFLWNSVFESITQIKNHKGSGSIIAHCMGLGKTLQIVTLVHTLFRYQETGIRTVLIITPHATIENWCKEFNKWLDNIPGEKKINVFNFTESKTYDCRKSIIEEWQNNHGVLISSYQMFRTVVNFKTIKKFPSILAGLLDPGPDVVVCDEGHILKNHTSAISKAIKRIKTLRRIVLTGTPLQNNLREYHCMVDFIRPNLLGSLKDFTNRFINPITNGQYSDSTLEDVKLMKRRSHVLHRMLEGFVQRFDYSVLTPFLPPKHEYVIYLRMSDKQIELYRHYLNNYRQAELFTNYHMLQMIWTHPKLLESYAKRTETKREKQKFKEIESSFLDDNSSSDSNSNSTEIELVHQGPVLESTKINGPEIDLNWWKSLTTKKDLESVYPYSKFIMMFSILKECEEIGDKVLIFSHSLYTLDLIQDFLENTEDINDEGGPYGKSWIQGEDFFRIDGSVSLKVREDCCGKFNDITNSKIRLLLLSTKAFNLGINLVGANRVIIFDVTWNPSLNVQSIFRVFRFGQNKPCYIYRLVSEGTMEQKMYERQISKLSMAFRVVDEHQIDRHFNARDQEVLYEFEPNSEPKSTLNLPKDRLMAELILKHKDLVMDILEHDSLLQNNEAEELDEFDRNAAWEDYQKEKEGFKIQQNNQMNFQNNPQINNPNISMHLYKTYEDINVYNRLKHLFPQASMQQLNDMLIQVKHAQNVEQ